MLTTNYTELRKNLKSFLDSVIDNSETLIINREGGQAVVMISLDEFNSIKETEYLIQPAMMKAIRKGIKDSKEGKVVKQRDGESVSDFLDRL